MSERRENSVLFSLSELRKMEEERVQKEEADRQARVHADLRAKEDAERRVREAEDAKRREGDELAMRERLERERMERDEKVRLQESEQRARVDAETRLKEQELHLAAQVKAKRGPIKIIVGAVIVLSIGVAGLGYHLYQTTAASDAERVRQAALLAQKQVESQKLEERLKFERQAMLTLRNEIEGLEKDLRSAKSDADRQEIQKKISKARANLNAKANEVELAPAPGKKHIKIGNDTNDPLDGI